MRKINQIVIHCADTPEGIYFDSNDIRKWHIEENGWTDIGYHYIILLDGTLELGRKVEVQGAHVSGFNTSSIGICYIGGKGRNGKGKDTRTDVQKTQLIGLLKSLKIQYPNAEILGHRDFPNVTKECPSFDAKCEYKNI